MDSIESYQIKSKLDYFKLKEIAEAKLFKACEIWTKQIVEGAVLIAAFVFFFIFQLAIRDGFAITNAYLNVAVVILFYLAFFGVLMIRKSVKKIKACMETYQGDLRRIQEKLTYSEIYMEIPEEDMNEFNSVAYLVKNSLKRMKKST